MSHLSSPPPSVFSSIPFSSSDKNIVADALQTRLDSRSVSQRAGGGPGGNVMYLEGWKAIEIANEIFGFNGWSSQIISQVIDFLDCVNDKWSVGIHCTVRVTLKDGSFHEDNGYGLSENIRSKGQAIEKARKESSTDALKRTLRLFGHALGNCLSDKEFIRDLCQPNKKNPYPTAPSVSSSRPTSSSHAPISSSSTSQRYQPIPPRPVKEEPSMNGTSSVNVTHGTKLGVVHPPSTSTKPLSTTMHHLPSKHGPPPYSSYHHNELTIDPSTMDWS